jgi:membrane protease YdiL (CAAX protease family)
MFVQTLGIMPIFILLQTNVQTFSSVPWSLAISIPYLWLFVSYLRGKGWPRTTAAGRAECFRVHPMSASIRFWAMVSGALLGATLASMVIWGWLLTEWPAEAIEQIKILATAPRFTVVPLLLLAIVATGVIEESAYRGYMQVPIERRHGPVVAICVVAIAFAFSHPMPSAVLPFFVFGSLGWGVLAYLCNSNLPGMIVHTLIDTVFFMWGIGNVAVLEEWQRYSVLEEGVNAIFLVTLSISVLFGAATIFAFTQLARVRQSSPG